MRPYRLDAAVLELSPGASGFLQAYSTQTPESPRGAFIDSKGKAVAVYHQLRIDTDHAMIIIARSAADRLQMHLKKYLSLSDVNLLPMPFNAYWDLTGSAIPMEGEYVVARGGGSGSLLITQRSLAAAVTEEEFNNFRLDHSIAVQGIDYDDPMLLNLGDPELVSFSKGCYLGQEIMARVHYRSRPPLTLTAVNESECSPELRAAMTTRTAHSVTGQIRGFVFRPTV